MQGSWHGLTTSPWWPPISVSAVLGGLPLLAYPVVVIVAIMALSAPVSASEPQLLLLVSKTMFFGAVLYPLVYGGCVIAAFSTRAENDAAPMVAALPLIYLLGLAALMGLLVVAGRR